MAKKCGFDPFVRGSCRGTLPAWCPCCPAPRTGTHADRAWLKPEPLHHHEGIFAIGIIIIDLKNITIPQSAVELLCVRIGNPYFQLDCSCKFDHELVLKPP